MSSRLVNVRLDPERLRRAKMLRTKGVSLSDLVRSAIDERFEALTDVPAASDVQSSIAEILDRYPAPPSAGARTYDVHDRAQAREAIRRKLRARR